VQNTQVNNQQHVQVNNQQVQQVQQVQQNTIQHTNININEQATPANETIQTNKTSNKTNQTKKGQHNNNTTKKPIDETYLDKISARVVDQLAGRLLGTNENLTVSDQRKVFNDFMANEESPAGFFLGLTLVEQQARERAARRGARGDQYGSTTAGPTDTFYRDPMAMFLDPIGSLFHDPWGHGNPGWWGEG